MKLVYILISLFALSLSQMVAVSLEKRKELISKIKSNLEHRRHSSPVSHLLKDVSSYHTINEDTIPATKGDIENYIAEKGQKYPPEILNSLRESLSKTEPEIFSKADYYQGKKDVWEEYIGGFVNENNEIYILCIKSMASGTKIVQKKHYISTVCKKNIFVDRICKKEYRTEDRELTPEETQKMKDTLAYRATEMFKIALAKIDNMNK